MMLAAPLPLLPNRRVLTAFVISIAAHGAVLLNWHWHAFAPAQLSETQPIDVRLVQETPVKIARATPRAVPKPAPRPVPRTEPLPQAAPTPAPAESPNATEAAPPATDATPLVEARSDVASLHNPKPPYPLAARRNGIEGTVLLLVHVREDGNTAEVTLKRTSGHTLLDVAALDTVKHWHFVPAHRGVASVDSWVDVPIRFRLESN